MATTRDMIKKEADRSAGTGPGEVHNRREARREKVAKLKAKQDKRIKLK